MKNLLFPLLLICSFSGFSQSNYVEVFDIMQAHCASCHSHANPEAGLDLEGTGTESQRRAQVYGNILEEQPTNVYAATRGYQLIYPGRPDLSYLFRKMNNGLEPTITLHGDEGDPMPKDANTELSDVEKEMIRQWILYGAKYTGTPFDRDLIEDYYNGSAGQTSFSTPPPAPAPGEGFQIKMGPFYLHPAGQAGDELEFFQKYELDLPEDLEVTRIDIKISSYSHHFILYDFDHPSDANVIPEGFREDPYHVNIGLTAAVQEATDLRLPGGTAFSWDQKMVLDLNSHYINYSASGPYQAESYINIYTQPKGTAAQEMFAELIANTNIYIPNNGDLITHSQVVSPNLGELFIWGLMGHTHKYGRGYQIYSRTGNQDDELIYDGACPQGIPGCITPYFDYQHIPLQYFEPLMPLTFGPGQGIRHEAQWENNGTSPVWFGPTSDDEMMVMIMMFTTDTTGIDYNGGTVNTFNLDPLDQLKVFPNPASDYTVFQMPSLEGNYTLEMYDLNGRVVRRKVGWQGQCVVEQKELPNGMYAYRVVDQTGRVTTGKLIWQE